MRFESGAGEGNRTLVASLEGWSSTIELRPRSEETPRNVTSDSRMSIVQP